VFILKRSAPTSLKDITYLVDAENQESADKKATMQFAKDLSLLAIRFRTTVKDIIKYFYRVELALVKVVK